MDVQIWSSQIVKGQYKDYLVGQLREGWRYQIDDNDDDDLDEDYNYDNENKHDNNGDRNKKQDTASFTKGFLDRMSGPLVQVYTIKALISYKSKIW